MRLQDQRLPTAYRRALSHSLAPSAGPLPGHLTALPTCVALQWHQGQSSNHPEAALPSPAASMDAADISPEEKAARLLRAFGYSGSEPSQAHQGDHPHAAILPAVSCSTSGMLTHHLTAQKSCNRLPWGTPWCGAAVTRSHHQAMQRLQSTAT